MEMASSMIYKRAKSRIDFVLFDDSFFFKWNLPSHFSLFVWSVDSWLPKPFGMFGCDV